MGERVDRQNRGELHGESEREQARECRHDGYQVQHSCSRVCVLHLAANVSRLSRREADEESTV